jgi:ribulose-phosphate 3-epimerase
MARAPIKIAPSLLAADLTRAGEEVNAVHAVGADVLHVDVMDGHFAPNLSFGPCVVEALDKACDIPMSVHLMVTDPAMFVEPYAEAGADDLLFHIELDLDYAALAGRIRDLGVRPGVAVEMDTPAERLGPVVGEIGIILVMTVKCGYTGQSFHPEPVRKIPALRQMFGDEVDIAVDGGVGVDNARMLAEAGANVLVAGKSIFWAEDRLRGVEDLRSAAEAAFAD